jgi:hypothetical protein
VYFLKKIHWGGVTVCRFVKLKMATSHFNLSTKLNAIFNLTNGLLAADAVG